MQGRDPEVQARLRRGTSLSHLYTIARTGTGKSTLLKTLLGQDLDAGRACALFDPHGDLVEEVVSLVPARRQRDLLYLNAMSQTPPAGGTSIRSRASGPANAPWPPPAWSRSSRSSGRTTGAAARAPPPERGLHAPRGGRERPRRRPADEFDTPATLTLATMLSELRKYRVGLVLAHQYLSHLETEAGCGLRERGDLHPLQGRRP